MKEYGRQGAWSFLSCLITSGFECFSHVFKDLQPSEAKLSNEASGCSETSALLLLWQATPKEL